MRSFLNFQEEGKKVIDIEQQALADLSDRIDEHFSNACEILLACTGKVIIIGIGKSGHIGKKIAATLASTGTPSFFVHPAEAVHGDLGMVTKDDALIMISHSGNTAELLALIDPIENIGAKMIAMTSKPLSPLAKAADVHLDVGVKKEACPLGLAPTASTTASMVLGDALSVALLTARGFTAEQFGQIHPGGTLGRRLSVSVADIMTHGDELPAVQVDATLEQALAEITEKSLGMTVILNADNTLAGILTDGDIRRACLNKQLNNDNSLSHLMTKTPKTLKPNDQAIGAINVMETYQITSIVITNEDHTVAGVIHMHRLLTAGLI